MRKSAALALILAISCARSAKPTAPERPDLGPQVSDLAEDAEALLREQDERVWQSWTRGAPLDLSRTYEGKDALFAATSVQTVQEHRSDVIARSPVPAQALEGISL